MEQRDIQIIEKFGAGDVELKSLWDQHVNYEKMVDKLESKQFLSPTETQELKELKKKKLAGKTKLDLLLDKYRETEA